MGRSKEQIAKAWKDVTFSDMKGVSERSAKELSKVLAFEKSLRRKR